MALENLKEIAELKMLQNDIEEDSESDNDEASTSPGHSAPRPAVELDLGMQTRNLFQQYNTLANELDSSLYSVRNLQKLARTSAQVDNTYTSAHPYLYSSYTYIAC